MVREWCSVNHRLVTSNQLPVTSRQSPLYRIQYTVYSIGSVALLLILLAIPSLFAAEESSSSNGEAAPKLKTLTLKMMIVNPSQKYKQVYPMKAYLPSEIKPQHVVSKEDLQIAYDDEKKSYYVTKEIELDPGQSVVKTVTVEDVWRISDGSLKELADEARGLFKKLEGTEYEEKGNLLINNVEVLMTQIQELQNDDSMTPEEHISAYRKNREKVREIELDMNTLRRLVFKATGDSSVISGLSPDSSADGQTAFTTRGELVSRNMKGAIPSWVAWRVIFVIVGFIGLAGLVFFIIWQNESSNLERRKRKERSEKKRRSSGTDSQMEELLKTPE